MDKVYRVFVDGKFITGGDVYASVVERAYGIVCYLGMHDCFENSKSPQIMDRWKTNEHLVIVTKNE